MKTLYTLAQWRSPGINDLPAATVALKGRHILSLFQPGYLVQSSYAALSGLAFDLHFSIPRAAPLGLDILPFQDKEYLIISLGDLVPVRDFLSIENQLQYPFTVHALPLFKEIRLLRTELPYSSFHVFIIVF